MSVSKHAKLLEKILLGTSDASIPFESLCQLSRHMGFGLRIKGSHHIFFRADIEEILNLQPGGGTQSPIR